VRKRNSEEEENLQEEQPHAAMFKVDDLESGEGRELEI